MPSNLGPEFDAYAAANPWMLFDEQGRFLGNKPGVSASGNPPAVQQPSSGLGDVPWYNADTPDAASSRSRMDTEHNQLLQELGPAPDSKDPDVIRQWLSRSPSLMKMGAGDPLKAAGAAGIVPPGWKIGGSGIEPDNSTRNTAIIGGSIIGGGLLAQAALGGLGGAATTGGLGADVGSATTVPELGALGADVGATTTVPLGVAGTGGATAATGGTLANVAKNAMSAKGVGSIANAISGATQGAAANRGLQDAFNLQGSQVYENQLMNRAALERQTRSDAAKDAYRAAYYNRPAFQLPAGVADFGVRKTQDPRLASIYETLANRGQKTLESPTQYDVYSLPKPKPITATQPGTMENIGNWAGPALKVGAGLYTGQWF